jgi:hypothetical protein
VVVDLTNIDTGFIQTDSVGMDLIVLEKCNFTCQHLVMQFINSVKRSLITLFLCTAFSIPAISCICDLPERLDSVEQLNDYEFIARVCITSVKSIPALKKNQLPSESQVYFEIFELFKGDSTNTLIDLSYGGGCSIGIVKGGEYLLYAKRINKKLSVVACDRNISLYRKLQAIEMPPTQGEYDLKKIRTLFNKPTPDSDNKTFSSNQNNWFCYRMFKFAQRHSDEAT